MKPSYVACSTVALAAFTSVVYVLVMPSISSEHLLRHEVNLPGYWGEPTAAIDWCEFNYTWVSFMAEGWNTITSLSYVILSVIAMWYYIRLGRRYDVDLSIHLYTFFCLFYTGVTSTIYHMTLHLEWQLQDKIGMQFLISAAVCNHYSRFDTNSWLHPIKVAQSLILSAVLWCTKEDRDGNLHRGACAVWITSFVFGTAYLFSATSVMTSKIGKEWERAFDRGFIIFLLGVFGWFIDNFLCDFLQYVLPRIYVPYLSPHGTLWHLGSCLGAYYIITIQIASALLIREQRQVEIRYVGCIVPYVAFADNKKEV